MGIPAPVTSFAHMAHVLGKEIMEAIERSWLKKC